MTDEEPQLSIRGVYYRLVLRGDVILHGEVCTKADNNAETVQRLILEFRRGGLLSYENIIDGTRTAHRGYNEWESAAEAVEWLIDTYERSIWADQPKRVELWSEKEALSIIVSRVTDALQVPLMPCKGFSSESFYYHDGAKRIARSGVPTVVLILTDHDRAGYNMADTIERGLRRLVALVCRENNWPVPPLTFERIGLNAAQVARYGLNTRPPKATDHPGMVNFVADCAEVDGLRSEQIEEIVRDAIEAHLDREALARTTEQQDNDVAALRRIARDLLDPED